MLHTYSVDTPRGPRTLPNTKQTQIFFVSKLTISKVQSLDSKKMQMNYKSSDFAELDRRCHSGSSRLRQIIFTNLHRTFRNVGDSFIQVKSLSRNQIYRAFMLIYLGLSKYSFSCVLGRNIGDTEFSCVLAGISATQRLPTSSGTRGTQDSNPGHQILILINILEKKSTISIDLGACFFNRNSSSKPSKNQ